jgi:hypothetical protein
MSDVVLIVCGEQGSDEEVVLAIFSAGIFDNWLGDGDGCRCASNSSAFTRL